MKLRILIIPLLLSVFSSAIADEKRFISFLSADRLHQNLNSGDKDKFFVSISYIGGVGDYLVKAKEICLPYEVTLPAAAMAVKNRLDKGLIEKFAEEKEMLGYVTAVSVVEYSFKENWPCN